MPRGRRGRRQKATATLNDLETQADRRRRSSEWTTLATTHGSVTRQGDERAAQVRAGEERRQRRRDLRAGRELRASLNEPEPEPEVSFAHSVFARHAARATRDPLAPLSPEPVPAAAVASAPVESAEASGRGRVAEAPPAAATTPAPASPPAPAPAPSPAPAPLPEEATASTEAATVSWAPSTVVDVSATPTPAKPASGSLRATSMPSLAYLGSTAGSLTRISSLGSSFRLSMDQQGGLEMASAKPRTAAAVGALSSADAEKLRATAVAREQSRKAPPAAAAAADARTKTTAGADRQAAAVAGGPKSGKGTGLAAVISRRQADRALQLRKLAAKGQASSRKQARAREKAQAEDEDDMTCGVCFELYDVPYRGECGHTICGGCLERLPRTDCPFCRAPLAEPATLPEIAGGLAHNIPVPHTFNVGDLVATPLPSIALSQPAKGVTTGAKTGGVKFAAHNAGFVWVAPPTGTKAGMTLCVALRVKYDDALARRVLAYKRHTQPQQPDVHAAGASVAGAAGAAGASGASGQVVALASSPPGSAAAEQGGLSQEEEEEESSESESESEDDSDDDDSAIQRKRTESESKDAASKRSGGNQRAEILAGSNAAAAAAAGGGSAGAAASFATNYLRNANMSELFNMHASFSNGHGNGDGVSGGADNGGAAARNGQRDTRRRQQQQQQQQQQPLLGGGRHRHATGSLVGGFAPSEWRGRQ